MEMIDILNSAVKKNASDIHIVINKPPLIRLRGDIEPLDEFPIINSEESKRLIYSILYDEQKRRFEEEYELDCSIQISTIARFRINVFLQKYGVEAVFRIIPSKIPAPEEIGLTEEIVKLADLPRGLVLVTGPTGSGKSTTLACLIQIINERYKKHILTIEDPIEFVYENKRSIIRQREVGIHTKSFASALKYALRQDPDVILVGEMRDLETISAALTVAETGHLVLATLHTQDAAQTIDRIIDVFPSHQQQQVRVQLSSTLKAVISQILLPRKDTFGRIAAREIMIVTPAIANLIREGKTHQIYTAIDTGVKFGMISLDKSLVELIKKGYISLEEALSKAQNPEVIRTNLRIGSL
ncbi:MAG: type IV pilus twitching motility protein PilT [Endomicrobia bacterium]|nr:type IV pilus twitching motility protein PilT [Endomicrobiia bacterium]